MKAYKIQSCLECRHLFFICQKGGDRIYHLVGCNLGGGPDKFSLTKDDMIHPSCPLPDWNVSVRTTILPSSPWPLCVSSAALSRRLPEIDISQMKIALQKLREARLNDNIFLAIDHELLEFKNQLRGLGVIVKDEPEEEKK